jgi:hypothetical protein
MGLCKVPACFNRNVTFLCHLHPPLGWVLVRTKFNSPRQKGETRDTFGRSNSGEHFRMQVLYARLETAFELLDAKATKWLTRTSRMVIIILSFWSSVLLRGAVID